MAVKKTYTNVISDSENNYYNTKQLKVVNERDPNSIYNIIFKGSKKKDTNQKQ